MAEGLHRLWSESNSGQLLRLARDIESQDSWRGYLTVQEHEIFRHVIQDEPHLWNDFIDGNVILRVEQPGHSVTSPPTRTGTPSVLQASTSSSINMSLGGAMTGSLKTNGPQTEGIKVESDTIQANGLVGEGSENGVENDSTSVVDGSIGDYGTTNDLKRYIAIDSLTTAFRVRTMLYEKSIGVLFPSWDSSVAPEIDYGIFDSDLNGKREGGEDQSTSGKDIKPVRKLEDDYDDDDDEEEDDEDMEDVDKKDQLKNEQTQQINPVTNGSIFDTDSKHIIAGRYHVDIIPVIIANKVPMKPTSDQDSKKGEEAATNNLNKMYHIFEHDREELLKQQKLEESDRQIDADPVPGKTSTASFGAANLSLKVRRRRTNTFD